MRILSVVTLISPQGEYGGPVRVALNQARELIELGHSVTVCAATRGFDTPPAQMSGVPLRLFPARQVLPGSGFAGLAAPSLWCGVARHVTEFDVCHIHAARDLVTLPAAAIARARNVPFVLQTHGMIDRSTKPLAVPLDLALTRPVLRGAGRILYLTPVERQGLVEVGGAGLPLVELPNGVPWADEHEPPAASEVLYLARLAGRKRPALFAEVAAELSAEFPDASFALVGPDEGEGDNVRRVIAASPAGERLTWRVRSRRRALWTGCVAPASTCCRRWTSRTRCRCWRRCRSGCRWSSPTAADWPALSSEPTRASWSVPVEVASSRPSGICSRTLTRHDARACGAGRSSVTSWR